MPVCRRHACARHALAAAGLLLALAAAGCRTLPPPAASQGPAPELLRNLEYLTGSLPAGRAQLVEGKFETRLFGDPDVIFRLTILPQPTATGDLNGDGIADAAVILRSETRAGAFHSLAVVVSERSFFRRGHRWRHQAGKYLGPGAVQALRIQDGRAEAVWEDAATGTPRRQAFRLAGGRLLAAP